MKKNYALLLSIALLSVLGACKKDTTAPEAVAPETTAETNDSFRSLGVETSLQVASSIGTASVTAMLPNVAIYRPSDATLTFPYQGGNGGQYAAMFVNSTGLTGLKLFLAPGKVVTGNSYLIFQVQGSTNGKTGIADFIFMFGGKLTKYSINFGPGKIGKITSIGNPAAFIVGIDDERTLTCGISDVIGGFMPAYSVVSTGVKGLTLSTAQFSILSSAKYLNFKVNGAASGAGTANFAVKYGGLSFNVPVKAIAGPPIIYTTHNLTQLAVLNPANVYTLNIKYSKGTGANYAAVTIRLGGMTLERIPGNYAKTGGTVQYKVTRTTSSLATQYYVGLAEAPSVPFEFPFSQLVSSLPKMR